MKMTNCWLITRKLVVVNYCWIFWSFPHVSGKQWMWKQQVSKAKSLVGLTFSKYILGLSTWHMDYAQSLLCPASHKLEKLPYTTIFILLPRQTIKIRHDNIIYICNYPPELSLIWQVFPDLTSFGYEFEFFSISKHGYMMSNEDMCIHPELIPNSSRM